MVPLRWQGYAITFAFLLGLGLLRLEADLVRRSIATALVVVAYGAVVILTWGDPESDAPPDWRRALLNRGTLVWLLVLAVIATAMVVAGFYGARPLH
jgi:multisubunit Na+/H+ antiporter MnhC subunit